jgi:hypothetical protein
MMSAYSPQTCSLTVKIGTDINNSNAAEVVLTKPLSMTNNKITNLALPTDTTEAVTKQ